MQNFYSVKILAESHDDEADYKLSHNEMLIVRILEFMDSIIIFGQLWGRLVVSQWLCFRDTDTNRL